MTRTDARACRPIIPDPSRPGPPHPRRPLQDSEPPHLLAYLAAVPDPRAARGRRHRLVAILGLAAAAVLAGARSIAAITEWAADAPQPVPGQLVRWAHVAVPAPTRGAGGGRCSGRHTRPAPLAADGSSGSASDPARHAEPCPPSAPRRRWPAAPAPACTAPLIPSAVNTASKAVVNFVSRSRSRNWKRPTWSASSMSRLRACWVTQELLGCGHASEVDLTGVQLDEQQHVQPLEPDRVDGEEGTGHDSGGLLPKEPCQVVVVRRGDGSSP
jgi:DDE_Tnp_1-associated